MNDNTWIKTNISKFDGNSYIEEYSIRMDIRADMIISHLDNDFSQIFAKHLKTCVERIKDTHKDLKLPFDSDEAQSSVIPIEAFDEINKIQCEIHNNPTTENFTVHLILKDQDALKEFMWYHANACFFVDGEWDSLKRIQYIEYTLDNLLPSYLIRSIYNTSAVEWAQKTNGTLVDPKDIFDVGV